MLGTGPALELVKEELADPTSDRVLEVLILAHERGGAIVREILDDLVDATTRDLKLLDELETEGLEMRINARAVVVLPWLVLVALTARPGAVPRLLPVVGWRRDAGARRRADDRRRRRARPARARADRSAAVRGGSIVSPVALLAASGVAAGVAGVAALVVPPQRRLAPRVRPYAVVARSALGHRDATTVLQPRAPADRRARAPVRPAAARSRRRERAVPSSSAATISSRGCCARRG